MRILRSRLHLLILPLCLIGCASTTGVSSKVRTVASIGDRPLPIVTGEPGATITADRIVPERRLSPERRISGRVVDEQGEPVPNVRVRLAVSGAPGGKIIRATTDRSGAFTLRGLRPGTPYTVIAEWEDEQGILTGRSEAQAPDTDVRIILSRVDSDTGSAQASRHRRVNAVSNRAPKDEEPEESSAPPAVNLEDLDPPPAPEAESIAPASSHQAASNAPEGTTARTVGWRSGGTDRAAAARSEHSTPPTDPEPEPDSSPAAPAAHGTTDPTEDSVPDDEGPNPLPPALEPDQTSHLPSRAPRGEAEALAQPPSPDARPSELQVVHLPPLMEGPESTKPPSHAADAAPAKRNALPDEPVHPPAPFPPDLAPGALAVVPEETDPVADRSAPPPSADQPEHTTEPRRRLTWRDLTRESPAFPDVAPELQCEVEQVAQRDEETLHRDGPPDRVRTGGEMPGTATQPSTRLEISRAPSPTEARPIRAIPVPEEFTRLEARNRPPERKYWAAAATCHMPLYFQDAALERYGHSTEQFFGPNGRFLSYPLDDPTQSNQRNQITQPFFSAALFAMQIGLWPYNLIVDPPWEAEYDLGYYRPADRVPTDVYYLPLYGVGPPLHGRRY